MSGWRVVTNDDATDYDSGVEAAVKHCRNVAANVTSLLLETYEDGLPDEVIRHARHVDNYVATERPGSRLTWTLGKPQPAFPREQANRIDFVSPDAWRTRAYYYALGQIESLWELSPLVEGDAVSFSYHFLTIAQDQGGAVSNLTIREAWVTWEAGRRANLERHGRPGVAAINLINAALQPHLAGGEHDPDLGPDLR